MPKDSRLAERYPSPCRLFFSSSGTRNQAVGRAFRLHRYRRFFDIAAAWWQLGSVGSSRKMLPQYNLLAIHKNLGVDQKQKSCSLASMRRDDLYPCGAGVRMRIIEHEMR